MNEQTQPLSISEQSNQPACKWCNARLPEYQPGHYCATFDPEQMFNYELTTEEAEAVEEILELSAEWRRAMRKAKTYLDPNPYYLRQDPRRYVISEHCFDKLLLGNGLICLPCFDRYHDRKQGKDKDPDLH